jgi:hypothetical protein
VVDCSALSRRRDERTSGAEFPDNGHRCWTIRRAGTGVEPWGKPANQRGRYGAVDLGSFKVAASAAASISQATSGIVTSP